MAEEINILFKSKDDGERRTYTEKMFTVTIALEEYRSLVSENARLREENAFLRNIKKGEVKL